MKNKKTNPNRIPVSQADVAKAKAEGVLEASTIILSAMRDKEGWGRKRLQRLWRNVEYLSDSIAAGKVSISDLRQALRDEIGINLIGGR